MVGAARSSGLGKTFGVASVPGAGGRLRHRLHALRPRGNPTVNNTMKTELPPLLACLRATRPDACARPGATR